MSANEAIKVVRRINAWFEPWAEFDVDVIDYTTRGDGRVVRSGILATPEAATAALERGTGEP